MLLCIVRWWLHQVANDLERHNAIKATISLTARKPSARVYIHSCLDESRLHAAQRVHSFQGAFASLLIHIDQSDRSVRIGSGDFLSTASRARTKICAVCARW